MTALSQRPRPAVTALTAPFWAAARDGELVRPVCGECGSSFFTPQIACPRCLSEDWIYEPSSGRGDVYSSTVVHRAPLPGFEPPYRIAIIDLEEGWSMLSNIVPAGEQPIPIGTPVEVAFVVVDDALTLPAFRVSEVAR
jgi:uncharacterized OB-fold protein